MLILSVSWVASPIFFYLKIYGQQKLRKQTNQKPEIRDLSIINIGLAGGDQKLSPSVNLDKCPKTAY